MEGRRLRIVCYGSFGARHMSIDRSVKGKRPVFVSGDVDANLNRLLAIISALSAEVAVLRDRQRTLEQLLATAGNLDLEDIESFKATPEDEAERDQWQMAFMGRIYRVLEQTAEAEAAAGPDSPGD